MDAGLPDHTVYRQQDLSALNGTTLPLIIWGNGACVNAGNSFSNFLTDISFYGFLAITLGPIVERGAAGPAQPPAAPAPAPQPAIQQPADTTQLPRNLPPAATHPPQMVKADHGGMVPLVLPAVFDFFDRYREKSEQASRRHHCP